MELPDTRLSEDRWSFEDWYAEQLDNRDMGFHRLMRSRVLFRVAEYDPAKSTCRSIPRWCHHIRHRGFRYVGLAIDAAKGQSGKSTTHYYWLGWRCNQSRARRGWLCLADLLARVFSGGGSISV